LLRWCSHGWLETGRLARPSSLPVGFLAAGARAVRADVVDRVAVLAERVVRPDSAARVDLAADLVDVDRVDDLVDGLLAVPDVLGGTDSPLSPARRRCLQHRETEGTCPRTLRAKRRAAAAPRVPH
jgi:hypothetical protein